jgi:hypothetical protein
VLPHAAKERSHLGRKSLLADWALKKKDWSYDRFVMGDASVSSATLSSFSSKSTTSLSKEEATNSVWLSLLPSSTLASLEGDSAEESTSSEATSLSGPDFCLLPGLFRDDISPRPIMKD